MSAYICGATLYTYSVAQAQQFETQAVDIGSEAANNSSREYIYFIMTDDDHDWTVLLVLLALLVECLCALTSVVGATELTTTTTATSSLGTSLQRLPVGHGHENLRRKQTRQERAGGMIVTYWGQYEEPSLQHACHTENYDIIILSFLNSFGHNRKPRLDLAGHCDPGSGGCTHLSEEIETCQRMGVRILLSLGGTSGNYGLYSARDAEATALNIWNSYLGGRSQSDRRPLGRAVLDGVDFDIEKGNPRHYGALATSLKSLMRRGKKRFILGAAPQCPFADKFMGPGHGTALSTGVFDYVWVQFYNNEQCHYDPKSRNSTRVLESWKR